MLPFFIKGNKFYSPIGQHTMIKKILKTNTSKNNLQDSSSDSVNKKTPLEIERTELILKVKKVQNYCTELVKSTPFDLTFEDKNKLQDVEDQISQLLTIVKTNNTNLAQLVEKSTKELTKNIETVEGWVNEVSRDIKILLPHKKIKHKPRVLRDPISEEIFQLLIFNAGSNSS
jgi:archaellum component FlaC